MPFAWHPARYARTGKHLSHLLSWTQIQRAVSAIPLQLNMGCGFNYKPKPTTTSYFGLLCFFLAGKMAVLWFMQLSQPSLCFGRRANLFCGRNTLPELSPGHLQLGKSRKGEKSNQTQYYYLIGMRQ